jgi:hypothetical protein
MAQQPPVSQGLLIVDVSRSPSDMIHPVGLRWKSDNPIAKTSTCQHTTFSRRKIRAPCGIRTHNPWSRAAADPRLRPCEHRDLNIGLLVDIHCQSTSQCPYSYNLRTTYNKLKLNLYNKINNFLFSFNTQKSLEVKDMSLTFLLQF